MKFYIDENLPYAMLMNPLAKLYRRHVFRDPQQEFLRGVEDIPLFQALAEKDFDAIITQDAMQLVNPDERDGLRASGLHWIGVPQLNEAGQHGIAAAASMIISGLPYFLTDTPEKPHIFRLHPVPAKDSRGPEIQEI